MIMIIIANPYTALTVVSAFYILTHSVFTTILSSQCYYQHYLHFINEKTETESGLQPPRQHVMESGLKLQQSTSSVSAGNQGFSGRGPQTGSSL